MQYKNFKTEDELRNLLQNSRIISGQFLCDYIAQSLSDESYHNKIFKNCIIIKGSFVSCSFKNCTFDNVVFRETDFAGTDFAGCHFRDCIFSNVDSGYTMIDTKIDHFSQFFAQEEIMEYHIKHVNEKAAKNTSANSE